MHAPALQRNWRQHKLATLSNWSVAVTGACAVTVFVVSVVDVALTATSVATAVPFARAATGGIAARATGVAADAFPLDRLRTAHDRVMTG